MKLSVKLPWDILSTLTPLYLHQEHACPPRLQEESWRIDGVLMSFRMLDLDESFSKAFLGYFYTLTTSPAQTRTSLPSKTLPGVLEYSVLSGSSKYPWEALLKVSSRSNIRKLAKTTPIIKVSSWSLGGHGGS